MSLRRLIALTGLVIAAVGIWGLITQNPQQPDQAKTAPEERPSVAPPVSSPSLSPSDSIEPVGSTPLRLMIESVDIDAEIYPHRATADQVLVPRSRWEVAWWSGGGRPGANSANTPDRSTMDYTTYLYGHTSESPAVFNRIGELEAGQELVVFTAEGEFYYAVEAKFTINKPALGEDPRITEDKPGRLVVASCWQGRNHVPGTSTSKNVVIIAQLVKFEAAARE